MIDRPAPDIPPIARYSGLMTRSDRWAHFVPRPGDVILSTPPKSGTTWMQGILSLLMSGDPGVDANPSTNAPWFDNDGAPVEVLAAELAARDGPGHVKTHTPLDGVPIWDMLRYIVVYRHPIDVHFSARAHVANYRPETLAEMGLDMAIFPDDPRESFRIYLEGDEMDHGSLRMVATHYLRSLALEPRANLLRLHYSDMTRDLPAAMERVAAHVGVHRDPETMARLARAATFSSMKANAGRFAILAGKEFWRDDAAFFSSGSSGKWTGILTEDDLAAYGAAIDRLMTPDQRHWLEWGDTG